MKSWYLARTVFGVTIAMTAGAAFAQAWTPGSELVGQPIQVTTNGVTNTVYLDPGGSLRIMTPGGNTVPGTWTAANNQLCLGVGGAQECVPYDGAFQPQQPKTMTSSCNSVQTWLAQSTNNPSQDLKGERGQ